MHNEYIVAIGSRYETHCLCEGLHRTRLCAFSVMESGDGVVLLTVCVCDCSPPLHVAVAHLVSVLPLDCSKYAEDWVKNSIGSSVVVATHLPSLSFHTLPPSLCFFCPSPFITSFLPPSLLALLSPSLPPSFSLSRPPELPRPFHSQPCSEALHSSSCAVLRPHTSGGCPHSAAYCPQE